MQRKLRARYDLKRPKLDIVHGDWGGAGTNDAHNSGSRNHRKSMQNIEAAKTDNRGTKGRQIPGICGHAGGRRWTKGKNVSALRHSTLRDDFSSWRGLVTNANQLSVRLMACAASSSGPSEIAADSI
jgi:hypothetical protein